MKKNLFVFLFSLLFFSSIHCAYNENNNKETICISWCVSSPSVVDSKGKESLFGGYDFNAVIEKETNQSKIPVDDIFNEIIKNIDENYEKEPEQWINPWESIIIYHLDKEYKQGDVIEKKILDNEINDLRIELIKKPHIVFDKGLRINGKYKDGDTIHVTIPLTIYRDTVLGYFVDLYKILPFIETELVEGKSSKKYSVIQGLQQQDLSFEFFKTRSFFCIIVLLVLLGISSYQAGWWKVFRSSSS